MELVERLANRLPWFDMLIEINEVGIVIAAGSVHRLRKIVKGRAAFGLRRPLTPYSCDIKDN